MSLKYIYEVLLDDKFYKDSELPSYLRYDNWDINEGLMILAGISPNHSEFGFQDNLGIYCSHESCI